MIEVAAMFNAGVGVLDDDEEAFLCIDAGRSPPRPRVGEARPLASAGQYYRNANLSRLGNSYCPGFPTGNARPGQKGVLLSRVWQPGQKAFVPVGNTNRDYQPGQKVPFFLSIFLFSILFLFQLYFYISIKLMY